MHCQILNISCNVKPLTFAGTLLRSYVRSQTTTLLPKQKQNSVDIIAVLQHYFILYFCMI